ncbi:MAG: glycosyltransferase, partial [Treponema sp.]|nr:glycosyltransferase [Treponema sp.]
MKFGIDAFGGDHARSGIGSYIHSFTANIVSAPDVQFELFGSELDRYTYNSDKDIPYTAVPVPDSLVAERFWHFMRANAFAAKAGYDCVLYPAVERVLPLSFTVPGVAVVNSIVSSFFKEKPDRVLRFQIRRGFDAVQKIIAPSKFIKHDLMRGGVNPAKIVVIHNGIDHRLFF